MAKKIINRSAVYRAVYYSGFDWSKSRTGTTDSYKLVVKDTNHTIYMDHVRDEEAKMDFIQVRCNDNLTEKELARFSRLCHKIMRRTRDLGIKQDLIELKEEPRAGDKDEEAK